MIEKLSSSYFSSRLEETVFLLTASSVVSRSSRKRWSCLFSPIYTSVRIAKLFLCNQISGKPKTTNEIAADVDLKRIDGIVENPFIGKWFCLVFCLTSSTRFSLPPIGVKQTCLS